MTAVAMGKRTFAPVRRDSRHEGEREHRVWHPIGESKEDARRFIGALIRAAEQFDNETKAPGKQMGALGMSGVKVLKVLTQVVSYRDGRLEPSIQWIQEKARLARATVVRALARLKQHGFLNWIRRTVPVDNAGAGPQVKQIPNAYWFGLAGEALALVKKLLGRTPPVAAADAAKPTAPRRGWLGKAAAAAVLGSWKEQPGPREALAALEARARARSASSESSQNPAGRTDI